MKTLKHFVSIQLFQSFSLLLVSLSEQSNISTNLQLCLLSLSVEQTHEIEKDDTISQQLTKTNLSSET